jgi:hypothetical protein
MASSFQHSLATVEAWLQSLPPEREVYPPNSEGQYVCSRCLLAQYFRSQGHRHARVGMDYWRTDPYTPQHRLSPELVALRRRADTTVTREEGLTAAQALKLVASVRSSLTKDHAP